MESKKIDKNLKNVKKHKCGCKKDYKSFAALYTHIKIKHKGVPPIGTDLYSNQLNLKEKNKVNKNDNKLLENFFEFLKDINCLKLISKDKDNFLEIELIDIDDNFLNDNKIFKIFESSFMNYYDFTKNIKEIFIEFTKKFCYKKSDKSYDILINNNKIKENYNNLNIYEVFFHFIIETYQYVEFKFFKEFFYIMVIYMHSLNKKGYSILNPDLEKDEIKIKKKVQFCNLKEFSIIIELSNIFIAKEFYKEYLRVIKEKENCFYFGDTKSQLYNLIEVILYFINWLNNKKYTKYKAELNIDL